MSPTAANSAGRTANKRVLAAAVAAYRFITKRRQSARAKLMRKVQICLQNTHAVVVLLLQQASEERRVVERALGKWRGSTLSGYLHGAHSDDQTYIENFRCTKTTFNQPG